VASIGLQISKDQLGAVDLIDAAFRHKLVDGVPSSQ